MVRVPAVVLKGKKLCLMYVWHVRQVKESTPIKEWKRKVKISARVVVTSIKKTASVIVDVKCNGSYSSQNTNTGIQLHY
jgi:hypothetical protein